VLTTIKSVPELHELESKQTPKNFKYFAQPFENYVSIRKMYHNPMKKTLLVLTVFFVFSSCSKDDLDLPRCKFNNATQDLPWLRSIIEDREANPTEEMKYCYIEQAKLKRKPVFVLGDCDPLVNKAVFILDCEGNIVKNEDDEEVYAVEVDLKNRKIIWKPTDFACSL